MVGTMTDMYDRLPRKRGIELRRKNKERLAELESSSAARRARLLALLSNARRNA